MAHETNYWPIFEDHMKKRYITHCDMGMVKIFTKDVSFFFNNNVGDVGTAVDVYIKKPRISKERLGEYIGHFTVKSEHSTWLSGEDEKIHMFGWWVHLTGPANLSIIKQDMDIKVFWRNKNGNFNETIRN